MIYTCPMHPEIVSDTPGHCPKCGMPLVLKTEVAKPVVPSKDRGLGVVTWRNYLPLIVIVSIIIVSSLVVSRGNGIPSFIVDFMAGLFLVFSGFKLIDLKGFAEGYSTYDLLAQRVFVYGYIYPFVELFFGLSMILFSNARLLLLIVVIVMVFSGIGVLIKLLRHEKFQCACLGTFLKVPLTKVTLIEDFGMAFLALLMLLLK